MFIKVIKRAYLLFFEVLGWKFHRQNLVDGIYILPSHTSLWDASLGWAYGCKNAMNPLAFLIDHWYDRSPKFFKKLKFFRVPEFDRDPPPVYRTFFKELEKEIKTQFRTDYRPLVITICPEGTLQACNHWKRGFSYLSEKLDLPIYVFEIDYNKKEVKVLNLEDPIYQSRCTHKEAMDKIRNMIDLKCAKYPEKVGIPRLKKEDG